VGTAGAKHLDVFLRRGVIPHVDVHCGGDHNGRVGCEVQRGEEVVRDSSRKFGQRISCSRRDQQKIRALSYRDVLDRGIEIRVPS
jgi:hypothetical protein